MPDYDFLIIDSYNIAHKWFYSHQPQLLASVSNKLIYLSFVKTYMDYIDLLKERFGTTDCIVYNLFDNPLSRQKLKHTVTQYSPTRIRYELDPGYKANRKKESKEFYNSIQFIKFLFSIKGPNYMTIRIPNLEADDLVKPLISEKCGEGKTLMVSEDMDWCRFLSPFVHVLSGGVNSQITTIETFAQKYDFPPSEEKIILHKILFGDTSDNIRPVFPEIPKKIRHNIVKSCRSITDLYSYSLKEFEDYKQIFEHHKKDMKIAYQLLSVIPVEEGKLDYYIIKGRQAVRLQEMVDKIFEEFESKKTPAKFSFGKLKCPRL